MSSSSYNHKLYQSRGILLDILHTQKNMNVSEFDTFSSMEIDVMKNENALDIFLEYISPTNTPIKSNEVPLEHAQSKIYIKYHLKSTLNDSAIKPLLGELFYAQSPTLRKQDTLIIVFDGEPSDSLMDALKLKYEQEGIFIVVHNIDRLQYNVLKHKKTPPVSILNQQETEDLFADYNIADETKQLPTISRFDPVALALCLRPKDIVKFMRNSPTAVVTPYYRICE
jgi:DNA-directed RNA polymerase subunit H (RpoH/RPB5)